MAISSSNQKLIFIIYFFFLFFIFTKTLAVNAEESAQCQSESGACIDNSAAFTLKIIALFSILITSIIGVSLPLLTKNIQALQPDRDIFTIVKSFAAGIILATGFMHVLPDSFDMLSSSCLPEYPWHKFPFTGFVAMLSAILALMVDSLSTSFYNKKKREEKGGNITSVSSTSNGDMERGTSNGNVVHLHNHSSTKMVETTETTNTQLLRYRIIAMVLEIGIIVHSVVIGLSLGASNNVCTIKPLVAALCFHQMFEGMGLGGCILQADYKLLKKTIMVIFFSITTPSGIILGLVIAKAYTEDSSTSLITEGILNAASAGLLIYMALVDLLSADFMGAKLQGNIKLQIKSYIAVLLGSGGMSLMAKWA